MAIVVVMTAMVTNPRGPPLAAHRHAASFAELTRLRLHAGGHLRHVRNYIGTKPHGVRGACLADGVAALGGRIIEMTEEQARQQYECADKVENPHMYFPRLTSVLRRCELR